MPGCIITEVNGKAVKSSHEVFDAVNSNTRLTITMLHKNRNQYERVTVMVSPIDSGTPTGIW